ncbi:MAG TPA: preprotein translocase subunit YajC [Faecalibacter sp.]|uniref:preprotein translocase subunit YajC n=1 Tax=Faecalibacter sp. LW9 TaxID=3103144 RepID=UPI002AFE8CF9|nr:preprotein translocase subunit YajC [Faecalibacter sp. LW9]
MIQTIFLQAGQGGYMSILMLGGMFAIMYFFMILPQKKKANKEKAFQAELKRGTQVVTTAGIHGRINEIFDDAVVIETGAGKIRFEKAAISRDLTEARYGIKSEAKQVEKTEEEKK